MSRDLCNRRTALKRAALLGLTPAVSHAVGTADGAELVSRDLRPAIIAYLEGLAKPDGGYGWRDQADAHLSVTFAVVGAYRTLGLAAPRPDATAAFVRQGHPINGPLHETRKHWAELKEYVFQQIQTLLWLGADVAEFKRQVASWRKVSSYTAAYEKGENPVLRQEVQPVFCRQLLGLPVADLRPAFLDYLAARQRKDGSFNNTPAGDGSGGHLVNTWLGLRAWLALGGKPAAGLAEWIERCQTTSGGFTWCPRPAIGGVDDLGYTWAAVHTLALLRRKPARLRECAEWLQSLWNDDGGFADRPGGASAALATCLALETLRTLETPLGSQRRSRPKPRPLPAELQAFTIQIQAPGQGSVVEAVEMARRLRIHLWGAKNAEPGWIDHAERLARRRGVPVTFFASNEEYGTRVCVPGLGNYTHVNDPLAAPGRELVNWPRKEGSWEQFQAEKLGPLHASGGRMAWQICDNEEFARVVLDESIARGGYDMISTFHFGCHNMAWTLPFIMRYQEAIPLVALQDAHLEAWWWSGNLAGYRTVFLAREPTWNGWLEALAAKRVVAVRRDEHTHGRLRMLGGSAEVRREVLRRAGQWQWWDPSGTVLDRVPASVVALRATDEHEPGRPDRGTVLRIRTRREWNENRGLLPEPLVECVGVRVDGRDMAAERIEKRGAQNRLDDVYQLVRLPDGASAARSVELDLVEAATGRRFTFKTVADAPDR